MSPCPNPSCGDARAYVGYSAVECPSATCLHFSPKLRDELAPKTVEVSVHVTEVEEKISPFAYTVTVIIGVPK